MRAYEFLREAKYDYSLADYEETPYDPGFEYVGKAKQEFGSSQEPHIGPQEGKYLNLMLRGMKPAAAISTPAEIELFKPYIEKGKIKVAASGDTKHGIHLIIVTLPNEEWRGPRLLKLFQHAHSVDGNVSKQDDAKIGMLLGLPKESIKYYLKTRHAS